MCLNFNNILAQLHSSRILNEINSGFRLEVKILYFVSWLHSMVSKSNWKISKNYQKFAEIFT